MGSSFSFSSGSSGPIPPQHQVFINFRGEELREGFVRLLVDTLKGERVNVYVDEEELRGKDLNDLFLRIEESKIALTIFSERYTESEWCLDELVKIKERMDQGNIQVIPIFFNVEADDVTYLRGKYGDNFRKLRRNYPKKSEKTAKWKEAIISVSNKFGLSSGNRCQRYFVKLISEEVKKVLREISKRDKEEMERLFRNIKSHPMKRRKTS